MSAEVVLRPPLETDGAQMWRLVRDSGVLDRNSAYVYLLIGAHFRDTSVVAAAGDRLVGFISGYLPPTRPDALFIWQVAVDAAARGRGIAGRMLDDLIARPACAGVTAMETTVTPSNGASRAMFASFARRHGATIDETAGFTGDLFPADVHEDERLLRIGPLVGGTHVRGESV